MEEELPKDGNQECDHRGKDVRLHGNPNFTKERALQAVQNGAIESHEWESVQVGVVAQLLWGCMMFVVLVSPKRSRHPTATAIQNNLNRQIKRNDS